MSTFVAMLLLGIGTYAFRASLVVAVDRFGAPVWLDQLLAVVTPAVLAAMATSSLLLHHGEPAWPALVDVLVVAAAVVVVRRTRNVGLGLAVGLPLAWLLALVV
ncbi:MAG TPA: AzlD domain-containing protein [Ilumatobacteraceae bacterium]|jgi:branched-subunit amino acid transport protein